MSLSSLTDFFATDGFMPHGMCLLWRPYVFWLHLASDGLIAAAYYSIPFALIAFVRKRPEIVFSNVFYMFSAFIFLCGTTHVMEIWTLWHPDYAVSGLVKLATAGVSLVTAVSLWPLMPKALALPSPAKLSQINSALEHEISVRAGAEKVIRELNADLERRVSARTAELAAANVRLRSEIEERRMVEARLRDSEQRYRRVVDLMEEGVWIHADNRILFANARAARLLGYADPSKMVGGGPLDLVAPEFRARVAEQSKLLVDESASFPHQSITLLRADGTRVEVEMQAVPFTFGNRAAVMTAARDLTAQRRLEAQLVQAQKMDAIGQLTGGVAHDFNNLLTVILGHSESLSSESAQEGNSRFLAEVIQAAAMKGAELTRRLVAFARQQPLEPRPTDVNGLIDGMGPLLHRTLRSNIDPLVLPEAELWPAMIDPSQLESSILNLVLNACDAMPEGGRLTIETANLAVDALAPIRHEGVAPGEYVMVRISDNGAGMNPDVAARAFDPFFTTKEPGKGAGLGLSMVYGFVKQSGGHATIRSEPGEGTVVSLYLPRATAQAERVSPHGSLEEDSRLRGKGTILVVEDDELVRDYVTLQIEGFGYQAIAVSNGHEALRVLASERKIDLLFTDVVMPGGLDGRALASQAQHVRPGLPVLFTSGYSENAITHDGRLDPGVNLISKPYRRRELAMRIREILRAESDDRAVS